MALRSPPASPASASGGLPLALGAYLIWGLLPLYLRLVHVVPPIEFVGWRVLFTLPVCLVLVFATRQGWKLAAALRNPRTLAVLTLSALLIGANWLIYIAAIQQGHVFAASIGYYINPLLNVLLGTVFLAEKLSRRQWLAVVIAAVGVAVLSWGARDTLAISLALAASFGGYGIVRKLAPVESLPGLTVETLLLLAPATVLLVSLDSGAQPAAFGHDAGISLLLALSGIVTAAPLLLFAAAARRMDLSALGFAQFLSPTLVFLLGLFVFHEPLRPVQLASLCLMWLAIAVYCHDLWLRRRAA